MPSCVIATRDSLFCKMFSPLFCFEQEKTVKNFSKKLYTSKIKKKLRRKVAFGTKTMPKLAQILKQTSGTRQVFVSVFFLCWSLYKTNRFHAAVGLFSNRLQRTSKCGKNISDTCTLACGSCATSSFLPHLTSSVIYYWTDAQQHRIYLLNTSLWAYHNTGGHFQWNLADRCMWSFQRYLPNKLHLDGSHDYRRCIYQRLKKPGEKEKEQSKRSDDKKNHGQQFWPSFLRNHHSRAFDNGQCFIKQNSNMTLEALRTKLQIIY